MERQEDEMSGYFPLVCTTKYSVQISTLTLVLLNPAIPCLYSVDPDQLASSDAN